LALGLNRSSLQKSKSHPSVSVIGCFRSTGCGTKSSTLYSTLLHSPVSPRLCLYPRALTPPRTMLPSRLLRAKHATAYQPMIKFLGQRSKLEHGESLAGPSSHQAHPVRLEPHAPAPHPAAPQDVVDNFQSFLAKKQSTSAGPESPSSTPKGQSTSQSAQGQTPGESMSGPQIEGESRD
jgi:hypothetical protein